MSTKKNIKVVSLTALVALAGMALAGCKSVTDKIAPSTIVPESTTSSEDFSGKDVMVTDEIGTALPFGSKKYADTTVTPAAKQDIGVLPVVNADGSYTLRFIAAVNDYAGLKSASFTRAAYTNAAGKVVAEKTAAVEYVYTEINDAASVKWTVALTEEYKYFMVYSIRNIPESDVFTTFGVDYSAVTSADATLDVDAQSANYEGVIGDPSVGVSYVTAKDDTLTPSASTFPADYKDKTDIYGVTASGTDITKAVVSPYVMTFAGYVATKLGTVRYLANHGSNTTGAFDSCSDLASLVLPDTVTYFGAYSLYRTTALKEFTLPAGVTAMASSAFNSSNFTTLNYKAKALVSANSFPFGTKLSVVNVSKSVTSLPDKFIPSGYEPDVVNYEGTTAEWTALEGTKENGLNIENVICSDTKMVTVNFHFTGATMTAGGVDNTDAYSTKIISGHKVADPGKPALTGKLFKGWYADDAFATAFDFDTALTVADAEATKTVDVYAKFEDYPAGASIDTALDITLNGAAASFTTNVDVPTYFFKYTAPADAATDRIYFKATTTASDDPTITAFDSTKTKLSQSYSYSPASTSKVFGNPNKQVWLKIAAGETYYFSVTDETKLTGTNTFAFDVALTNRANDIESEAIAYTWGADQKTIISEGVDAFYSFTAPETGTYYFKSFATGSFYSWSLYLYHFDAEGKAVTDGELSSSKKGLSVAITKDTVYYVYGATSNSTATEANYLSFAVTPMPEGSSAANATALTVSDTATTVALNGFQYRYYTFTPAETATYSFILTGGSTYYSKTISITADGATTALATGTEAGTVDEDGYSSYGTELDLDQALTISTKYSVKVGYTSPSGTTDFSLKIVKLTAGDKRDVAISLPVGANNTLAATTVVGRSTGIWYTYTPTAASGFVQLHLAGATGTVSMKTYSGTRTSVDDTGTDLITSYMGNTTQQYIYITDTVAENLTLEINPPDTTTLANLSTLALNTTLTPATLATAKGHTVYKFTTGTGTDFNTALSFLTSTGTATFNYALTTAGLTAGFSGSVTADTTATTAGTVSKTLEASKTYYLVITDFVPTVSTAALSVTASGVVIPPDGKSKATAFDFAGDATTGLMAVTGGSSNIWFKYTCTTAGTYRVWSRRPTGGDPKLLGIYEGTSSTAMTNTAMDDIGATDAATYSAYVAHKYDFYVEVTFTAGTTYYVNASYSASSVTDFQLGILLKA